MWSPNGPSIAQRFLGINVTFDDKIGVGGNFQVVGHAFDQFDGFFAQITRQQKFVHAIRQRRRRAKREDRIAAEKNAHRHALAGFVITSPVARGDFLQLPMHARGLVVINLDAIHADIAFAGVGIFASRRRAA